MYFILVDCKQANEHWGTSYVKFAMSYLVGVFSTGTALEMESRELAYMYVLPYPPPSPPYLPIFLGMREAEGWVQFHIGYLRMWLTINFQVILRVLIFESSSVLASYGIQEIGRTLKQLYTSYNTTIISHISKGEIIW